MTAIFVSATGTDVGKTFVTTGLIRHYLAESRAVDAIKPVVSGFDPAAMAQSDPGALLTALGRPLTIEEIQRISPWRFAAPLSPDMAARREGRAIDFDAVTGFCRSAMGKRRGLLLIEGIGGIMVPLDQSRTVVDLMTQLRLPIKDAKTRAAEYLAVLWRKIVQQDRGRWRFSSGPALAAWLRRHRDPTKHPPKMSCQRGPSEHSDES
jgi:dethiobiotin synthase